MSNLNYVNQVIITNTEAANTGTTVSTAIVGDVLIVNEANTVLTGGANTRTSNISNRVIRLAWGAVDSQTGNTTTMYSQPINLAQNALKSVTVASYSAPTNQVQIAGYTGSSGSLATPSSSTEYALTIVVKDDQRFDGNRQTNQTYLYTTPTSATAFDLAFGMVSQIQTAVTPFNTNSYVLAEVLTDGTFTALTNNATVTQYGSIVSSTAHGLVAGDYVRIGGTAATVAVYKVRSVTDANTFVIYGSYMGTSGTVLNTNIGKITVATVCGIKLTARTLQWTPFKYEKYSIVNFDAKLATAENLGTTSLATFTTTTSPFPGVGFWKQVRDMDYDTDANKGYFYHMDGIMNAGFNPTSLATSTYSTYNLVTIVFDGGAWQANQTQFQNPQSITVAFYSSTAPTASTKQTAFLATLESLAESQGIFVQ